jgi:hypothetical protein
MKTLITTITALLISSIVFGQTPHCNIIEFDYDNAGNRILREYDPNCIINESPGTLRLQEEEPSNADKTAKPDVPQTLTEEAAFAVNIYPNPTTGEVSVVFDEPVTDATLVLYDLTGTQVMHQPSFTGSQTTLDLSGMSSGVYLLSVVTRYKTVSVGVVRR